MPTIGDRMNNKMIMAVAAVIILIGASVGAVLLLKGPAEDAEDVDITGVRLVIYGNANSDDYLDQKDVDLIQDIVDGKASWNRRENPLADTNADGRITQEDVTLLNKILNKEQCIMYYYDYAGTVQSVHYPITGNLAVLYNYGLDAAIILGCYDRVVAATDSVINKVPSNTEARYPGIKSFVNISDPASDPESLLQAGADHGVTALFGIAEAYMTTAQEKVKAAGSNIDVITINTSGYKGKSCDYIGGILTLGVMFGCEDRAYEYVKLVDETVEYLAGKLSGVTKYSVIYPQGTKSNAETSIRTTSSDGGVAGNVYTLNILSLNDLFANKMSSSGFNANMEDIIDMNPDVIIISTWGTVTDSMTYAEVQYMFETMADYFSKCDAYSNGMIFYASFEAMGTFSGIATLPLLASFIWPDAVDEQYGWDLLQSYYDKFTKLSVDVKDMGCLTPHKL